MCGLVADLYQLVGETFFDGDHYTDAAHCYLLATQAAREAKSPDLWAAALTRHSFIDLHARNHANALPMLDLAEQIAHRGNTDTATRFWVTAVRAETHAALRNNYACEKDLAFAAEVAHLDPATATNGGWLRFDGDRLPEQTGDCMITLGRFDTAETALTTALTNAKTPPRRATVNADLAVVAAHHRDPARAAAHLHAAITTAHTTGSGYLAKKLDRTRPELAPLADDPRIRAVTAEITDLGRVLHIATTY